MQQSFSLSKAERDSKPETIPDTRAIVEVHSLNKYIPMMPSKQVGQNEASVPMVHNPYCFQAYAPASYTHITPVNPPRVCRLHVRCSPTLSKQALFHIFGSYGTIRKFLLLTDKVTKKSRGSLFVTYETIEATEAAIEALNGILIAGQMMYVQVAHSRRGTPPQSPVGCKRLFVVCSPKTTEIGLHKFFHQFGKLQTVTLLVDKATGGSRGSAFVTFATPEATEHALQCVERMGRKAPYLCRLADTTMSETSSEGDDYN